MSKEAITDMLRLSFGDKLLNNFTILDKERYDHPLYHVSDNGKIKEFTPRFSTRLYTGETKAIMRTSTATSIINCHKGLGAIVPYEEPSGPREYFIYEMEWDYCVIPTKKEVPDIQYTKEHWLLAFDLDHRVYKGEVISTFFLSKDTTVYTRSGQLWVETYLLKVSKPVYLTEDVLLKPGFYEVEYRIDGQFLAWKPVLHKNLFIKEISKVEYTLQRKRLTEKSVLSW